ncbi:MAG: hypothetical protein R2865_03585 [Deinococcales bacterium]
MPFLLKKASQGQKYKLANDYQSPLNNTTERKVLRLCALQHHPKNIAGCF